MTVRFHATDPARGWESGRLLPAGWRPDRDVPPDEPRWVVVGPTGHLRLRDGSEILLRPLSAGDGQLLAAGFERLSAASRYRRFLSPVPRLTDSMLTFLTSVDGSDHRAWGALIAEPDGPVGAGVVRWVRSRTDPGVAEMAVTVIDDYQGRGLGGLLVDVAVLDASAHGVERFEGLVLAENVSSRRMLTRAGATLQPDGGGALTYQLPLPPRVDLLRDTPLPTLVSPRSRRARLYA